MAQPEVQEQNSPAMVTSMTAEHFVLQTARSAGISEVNGRAGFYQAAVSSGLIALAFIGQLSRLGTAFYVFGLVLLPTLAFIGITTFERALRNGVEDVQLAGRINRIRQFYFDAAPQIVRYLPPPAPDNPADIAAQVGVSSPSWYQFLTIAGAVAVVNSVLSAGRSAWPSRPAPEQRRPRQRPRRSPGPARWPRTSRGSGRSGGPQRDSQRPRPSRPVTDPVAVACSDHGRLRAHNHCSGP